MYKNLFIKFFEDLKYMNSANAYLFIPLAIIQQKKLVVE